MTSTRLDCSRASHRSVWVGVLLASALCAPARLAAQDGKTPKPISLEELHREVRPRLRKLAERALNPQPSENVVSSDDLTFRRIERQRKDGAYQQAKLIREVAEINVKEYEEGVYLQQRATLKGEIQIAEFVVEHPKAIIDEIEAVLQKMKKFEPTSNYDRTTVYELERDQRAERLRIVKGQVALLQARGKLKGLDTYEKPKRIKELQSEVEKAGAEESMKKADLESIGVEVKLLEQQLERDKTRFKPDWSPVLDALDEAAGLERDLQTQLKEEPPADPKARGSWDEALASRSAKLRTALDEAEQRADDVAFDQLGGKIHELLSGPDPSTATPPKNAK